ncbi:MAG: multicopper oxidase domain-containing protein, partial [Phycisphaerales bacterium]
METSGITNKTDRSGNNADEDKRASFQRLTRRAFLGSGAVAGTGVALTAPLLRNSPSEARTVILASHNGPHDAHSADAHRMGTVGTIGEDRQPVRPMHFLGAFNEIEFPELLPDDFHRESKLPNGRSLHEYLFIASDKDIEIAPGLYFPAWTYNGQVPGPTLRATRGDRIRIWFINEGSHPHTIHFHGWHPFEQDGSMLHQFVYPSTGEAME